MASSSGESKSDTGSDASLAISAVRSLLAQDARAAAQFDDATILRFLARVGNDKPAAASEMLKKALYMRGAIGYENLRLNAVRSTADSGFICLLDRANFKGDVIMMIKWSLYHPKTMPCEDLIVIMISYFEEALRRIGGRPDGKIVVWLDYKDWAVSQSDSNASKILVKVLEALYCNVMRSVVMVHCSLFARGLIKLFKTFSSKSLMNRVHVCAHVSTALEISGMDASMLPPIYGGTNAAYDLKKSVADIVAQQGPGPTVYVARDDFSHHYGVACAKEKASLSSNHVLSSSGLKITGTMFRTAGLFKTLVQYGYALSGPLLYTWEAPRKEGAAANVHKVMEVCEVEVNADEGSLFPFTVKGFTAAGMVETWRPKGSSEEERQAWVKAIKEAIDELHARGQKE